MPLQLITCSSLIASEAARRSMSPMAWYFHPDFASDVDQDVSLETLERDYQSICMPSTNTLEHVYVPILDAVDGWYLLLLDVKVPMRFVLDVCCTADRIPIRMKLLNKIGSPDPTDWGEYRYPEAIPHNLQRIFGDMGGSDRVRMRSAWYILQLEANQMRGYIDARADLLWRDMADRN
ncbi:hypothetical protein PIB30_030287 [Stylosanthes scabra]|uniref:Uncharacterized protein n=1 Tax=Stylosanthes scabra TaxID=79078 RepID=A0ABU6QB56_9FABA|nr:hypothetical protein [Stylosanthes scabra]